MQNLAKQWKEPPVIILQQANFYNTYSVVVAKNHQNIRSRFLVHEFSLTDIFLNSILYGCDFSLLLWKGAQNNAQCNCIHTSLSIFILFQLQSWIILKVRTEFLFKNFHVKRVIMEIAMMNILNNCISGRWNNNYFPSLTMSCLVYSISDWKNSYLKNYSKVFNLPLLPPYSYPKQTTHWTKGLWYWPNIQWFVICLF